MTKCKFCHVEIPISHEQVGGVHMNCEYQYFQQRQKIMKLRPIGQGPWLIGLPEDIVHTFNDADSDAEFEVKMGLMSFAELDALEEHGGW